MPPRVFRILTNMLICTIMGKSSLIFHMQVLNAD